MLRRLLGGVISVTVVAESGACGGTLAPDDRDAGARRTSSSSSSSSSSGAVGGSIDAGRAGQSVSPGLVACPDRYDQCGTETGPEEVRGCCVEGGGYSCRAPRVPCAGAVLACDEGADCNSGECCAEELVESPISSRRLITTQCRPSCVTGLPRARVCTSNADCDGSACREWSCGGFDMMGIKTCAPLGPCD